MSLWTHTRRATTRQAQKRMSRFTYVYILQSEMESERFYIGRSKDLRARVSSHNAGDVRYTSKWKPWRVKTYVALLHPERALALERYLKSSAGRGVHQETPVIIPRSYGLAGQKGFSIRYFQTQPVTNPPINPRAIPAISSTGV